jgi:glycosyltransferase involved in cell wall biosynthesis
MMPSMLERAPSNPGQRRDRPTIGMITSVDARTRGPVWATTGYYMARTLEEHCGNVVHLFPVTSPVYTLGKAANKVTRRLGGRSYDFNNTWLQARDWARAFAPKLNGIDVLLAVSATPLIALLDTTLPIVYTSDATFARVVDYYPFYSSLPAWNVRTAERIERLGLQRAALLTYPSQWAATSARDDYGVADSKIHVVPYGANFDSPPTDDLVRTSGGEDSCRLLFVGVEWERKGGAIAYETMRALRRMGINAELVIVGCQPPAGLALDHVRLVPWLRKEDPSERNLLSRLFLQSQFLLLPTRAECYGMVFCEASAHGRPSIATDTGGVSGAVVDGENGFLLPIGAGAERYASLIAKLHADPSRYRRLVASSRRAYETRLNWDCWGRRVGTMISSLLGGSSSSSTVSACAVPDGAGAVPAP